MSGRKNYLERPCRTGESVPAVHPTIFSWYPGYHTPVLVVPDVYETVKNLHVKGHVKEKGRGEGGGEEWGDCRPGGNPL